MRKVFGPTVLSFLSYCGINLIFLILPIIFWVFDLEGKKVVSFVCFIYSFTFLFPVIIRDINWIKVTEEDLEICKFFSSQKIKWKDIAKVKIENMYYRSYSFRVGPILFIEEKMWFYLRNGRAIYISPSMISKNAINEFMSILTEKSFIYGFHISHTSYSGLHI